MGIGVFDTEVRRTQEEIESVQWDWLLGVLFLAITAAACSPNASEHEKSVTADDSAELSAAAADPVFDASSVVVVETSEADVSGGVVVEVAGIAVSVPSGAIADGDTLSVSLVEGGPPLPGGSSGAGVGTVHINTSAGQPSGGVEMVFPYDPTKILDGSKPVVVHFDEHFGVWQPETTIALDTANDRISVTASSLSFWDVMDWTTYHSQLLLGNRSSATPSGCDRGGADWISNASLYNAETTRSGHADT